MRPDIDIYCRGRAAWPDTGGSESVAKGLSYRPRWPTFWEL